MRGWELHSEHAWRNLRAAAAAAHIHHDGDEALFSRSLTYNRGELSLSRRFMSRFINARSPVLPISYAVGRLIPSHWSVSASDEGIFCARKLCGSAQMTLDAGALQLSNRFWREMHQPKLAFGAEWKSWGEWEAQRQSQTDQKYFDCFAKSGEMEILYILCQDGFWVLFLYWDSKFLIVVS